MNYWTRAMQKRNKTQTDNCILHFCRFMSNISIYQRSRECHCVFLRERQATTLFIGAEFLFSAKKCILVDCGYSPMFCMHAIYSTLTFIKILQALSSAFELKIHENGEAKHVKKRDLNPGWKAKQSCRIPQVLHRELFKSPFSVSLETLTAAADKTTTTCYYLHIDEILEQRLLWSLSLYSKWLSFIMKPFASFTACCCSAKSWSTSFFFSMTSGWGAMLIAWSDRWWEGAGTGFCLALIKAALTAGADRWVALSLLIDLGGTENPNSAVVVGVSRSGRLELELSLWSKVHIFVLRKSLDHQNHETLSHVCLSWSPLKVGMSMLIVW